MHKPLSGYSRIVQRAGEGASAEELLGDLIELLADAGAGFAVFSDDPSVRFAMEERARRHDFAGKTERIITAISGPTPSNADRIRAGTAFAVAKEGTWVALWLRGDRILAL
jgi:hypothetical protein